MGSLSFMHWLVVVGVILLFAGPKRIPELAKALGKGIREFKKALGDPESSSREDDEASLGLVQPLNSKGDCRQDLIPLSEVESSFHPKAKIR
jgi:sec-independent protein translocase protein TatA